MNGTLFDLAAQAEMTLTEQQREMLAQMVTAMPPSALLPAEAPVFADDLRVISNLRARILDEMERLIGGEVDDGNLVTRLGMLCMQSLHYVLAETGEPNAITQWVEAALLTLAEAHVVYTPQAHRDWLVQEGVS